MPISSLILEVEKENRKKIALELGSLQGVEVEHLTPLGKIIITTQTQRLEEDRALNEALEKFPGVLSCRVVFGHFEDCIQLEDNFHKEDNTHG